MTRIFWLEYRDEDGEIQTEKCVVHADDKTDIQIINSMILRFNYDHRNGEMITGITEIRPRSVVRGLEMIMHDYKNKTLCFTGEDAEWIGYAIEMLKNMEV